MRIRARFMTLQALQYYVLGSTTQSDIVFICSRKSLQKLPQPEIFHSVWAGYWLQFSTSNNSTSLFDHWLLYRHCAKLTINETSLFPIKSNIKIISDVSNDIKLTELKKATLSNRQDRILKKEDIDASNIIEGKRERKKLL